MLNLDIPDAVEQTLMQVEYVDCVCILEVDCLDERLDVVEDLDCM